MNPRLLKNTILDSYLLLVDLFCVDSKSTFEKISFGQTFPTFWDFPPWHCYRECFDSYVFIQDEIFHQ